MKKTEKPYQEKSGLLSLIGNTPLLSLKRIGISYPEVSLFAKAEWFNPGGSVKDRAAYRMIREGEKSGKLTKEKVIIDATSGNTGIAYAMISAVLGYQLEIVLPENASIERKKILISFGTKIHYSSPLEGSDGAILMVRKMVSENPGNYFYPDQYKNPENWKAHYESTGEEIIKQMEGVDFFIAGLGTTGTLMGAGRKLKERFPDVKIIAVQPDAGFHGLEGLKHMETSIVPEFFDPLFPDETIYVSTEDAYRMVLRLSKEEGIFAGVSSGAVVHACMELAQRGEKGNIVTILPDSGDKYLSERFWEDYSQ